jgi:GNAT superfamily N-acetyltransferase
MSLVEIAFPENLKILHETHDIWSAGLSRSDYLSYQYMQKGEPWGRRQVRQVAVYDGSGELAAGCKCYEIEIFSKGHSYSFIGIGAMYSLRAHRGQGYAAALLDELIVQAENASADGLILFSDIGAVFYEQFGFQELSSVDFSLTLSGNESIERPPLYKSEALSFEHIDTLERYRWRWQARRPFGLVRESSCWHYKIAKEKFLHSFSSSSWPGLQLITLSGLAAYCIYEVGGRNLRILELVNDPAHPELIWQAIFFEACKLGVRRIRGWESNILELAPDFNVRTLIEHGCGYRHTANPGSLSATDNHKMIPKMERMHYQERNWGRIMMHFINPDIEHWAWQFPCPIMEMDHL